jgi:hypothetical protein
MHTTLRTKVSRACMSLVNDVRDVPLSPGDIALKTWLLKITTSNDCEYEHMPQ